MESARRSGLFIMKNRKAGYIVSERAISVNNKALLATTAKEESGEIPASFAEDEVPDQTEERRVVNRDKSGLTKQHRNMLHNIRPYEEANSWIHNTEKYQRMMFGRYGLSSKVNPRVCFPTKSDIREQEEYEHVAFPHTIQELMKQNEAEKKEKQLRIQQREDEIEKKLQKLDQWKKELNTKVAKKEADAVAAKERKDRIVEEVRRHFGFKIDPRDERFKELLEQKEKEDKKKQKEAKKKAKEEKMLAKLTGEDKKAVDGDKKKGAVKDEVKKNNELA